MSSRRHSIATWAAFAVLIVHTPCPAGAQAARDSSFAVLVARTSESGGYFDSDNIITNEGSYLQVASQLARTHSHGGVYVGVGPDQNFSYIALIKPTIAFMIDIRRDNLLEHLLFKSLFAMSRNRLEYLCLLLGKPVPADVEKWTNRPVSQILAYLASTASDSQAASRTAKASNDRIARFQIPLDGHDREVLDQYRRQFISEGLDTRYSSLGRNNRADYPSLAQLIVATDREGHESSYLADEQAFQYVRTLQLADRIIPVVGNIAGDKAVKAIASYATERRLKISAFYVSNVEQYLMGRDGGFDAYANNVKSLPHDSTSVIIRSYFGGRFSASRHPLYMPAPGNISTSLVETIDSFIRAYSAGELTSYGALVSNRYVNP